MSGTSSRRKLALGFGIVVVVLVAGSAILFHEPLWHRWLANRAADALAAEDFDPSNPGEHFETILAAGPDGDVALARLLGDSRYRVWTNAVYLLDVRLSEGEREAFIARLRERDLHTLVRYLLVQPYRRSTEWRADYAPMIAPKSAQTSEMVDKMRTYWTGDKDGRLPPNAKALHFLEAILDREIDYASDERYYHRLEMRAIAALSTMLPRGWTTREPNDPALAALARVAKTHPDDEVRFFATVRLLQSHGPSTTTLWAALSTWDQISLLSEKSPSEAPVSVGEHVLRFAPVERDAVLWPLVYFDHPRSATILARLWKAARHRETVEAALARRFPELPLTPPSTTSIKGRALALLEGDAASRRAGAYVLSLLGLSQHRAKIETLRAAAVDGMDRKALDLALIGLGAKLDATPFLEKLQGDFEAQYLWIADPRIEPPPDLVPFLVPFVEDSQDTISSWPNIDNSRGLYTGFWQRRDKREEYHRGALRIAWYGTTLLRSGRLDILTAHFEWFTEKMSGPAAQGFLFAHGRSGLELADYIDDPAIPDFSHALRFASNVTAGDIRKHVRKWWDQNQERLHWNAERRVWELEDDDETPKSN